MKFHSKLILFLTILCFTASEQASISYESVLKKYPIQIQQHLDRVIIHLRNNHKIIISLGEGDNEIDYNVLGIHMMVSNLSSNDKFKDEKFLFEKIGKTAKQPFLIPLDFNSKEFFDFLSFFRGRIDRLIFALSTTKFVQWDQDQRSLIYSVLCTQGGLIYPLDYGILHEEPFKAIFNRMNAHLGRNRNSEIEKAIIPFENVGFDVRVNKDAECYTLICVKPRSFISKENIRFLISLIAILGIIYECFFRDHNTANTIPQLP